MKLTIAIPPHAKLHQHLARLCTRLPQADWAPSETCFLPLRHLGNVTNYDILDALDVALLRMAPRQLSITLAGLKLEAQGPIDIIYLEVAPTEALISFRSKVENAVRRCGHPLEKRRYRPRFRIGTAHCSTRDTTIRWAQRVNMDLQQQMDVDRFCLYESIGDAENPFWVCCEDYPLMPGYRSEIVAAQMPPGS